MSTSGKDSDTSDNVVRIRGLPWQATKDDIFKFFSGCKIKGASDGIKMTLSNQGRPSGEAYIEFENDEDYKKALDCHKKHMGSRYIEVFPSNRQQMLWMVQRSGLEVPADESDKQASFVRIRGLPFGSRSEDIVKFFDGLEITNDGIVFPLDNSGRQTGEAYVKFANASSGEKALAKHKEKIAHRYIEVFKSSSHEFRAVKSFISDQPAINGNEGKYTPASTYSYDTYSPKMPRPYMSAPPARPSPYDRFSRPSFNQRYIGPSPAYAVNNPIPTGTGPPPIGASRRIDQLWTTNLNNMPSTISPSQRFGFTSDLPSSTPTYSTIRHVVHMRGLPYKATQANIQDFFRPLVPSKITILKDDLGRPSGEADVEFFTHGEAEKAMNKDKANMQHRYIELFLHSTPNPIAPLQPPAAAGPPLIQGSLVDSAVTSFGLRSFQTPSTSIFPNHNNGTLMSNNVFNTPSNVRDFGYAAGSMFRTHDDVLRSRI